MNFFNHLIGNEHLKQCLETMLQNGRQGQSFLFAGPEGIGKGLFALALAEALMLKNFKGPADLLQAKIRKGEHPDLHIYRPEGKIGMHSIDALRRFQEEVYMAPFESQWKVFIIHDADRMLLYSANALLKTFEEPAADTLIILLSSTPENLLPTILSRCRRLYFQPIASHLINDWLKNKGVEEKKAESIALKARGSFSEAIRLLQKQEDDPQDHLAAILRQGPLESYAALKQAAQELGEKWETLRELFVKEAHEFLWKGGTKENFSATQREIIEKEIEGAATMRYLQSLYKAFEYVLAWYRDMLALQWNSSPLLFCEEQDKRALEQAIQKGAMKPLEEVEKAIAEMRLAVERFTPLNSCWEILFLKLDWLDRT